jgi:hypothetical protein
MIDRALTFIEVLHCSVHSTGADGEIMGNSRELQDYP